jgi:hypothetical protein
LLELFVLSIDFSFSLSSQFKLSIIVLGFISFDNILFLDFSSAFFTELFKVSITSKAFNKLFLCNSSLSLL